MKSSGRKETRSPEAAKTRLRVAPPSALASIHRRHNTPLGLNHEASDILSDGTAAAERQ